MCLNFWSSNNSNVSFRQACGGLTYTYAVYSGHLKNVLHYTQEQTDDVGAAKDFGSVLGLLSGFFYNFYPPWVTICIGAFLHLFGYCMVLPPRSNDSREVVPFWSSFAAEYALAYLQVDIAMGLLALNRCFSMYCQLLMYDWPDFLGVSSDGAYLIDHFVKDHELVSRFG